MVRVDRRRAHRVSVTWTDHHDAGAAQRVGRSDVTSPGSICLRVSRSSAHVDIVAQDGWAEVTVLRPGPDTVVRATAQLESVAAFAAPVDRAVELITRSGIPRTDTPAATGTPLPPPTDQWVLGYDGERWSNGPRGRPNPISSGTRCAPP
jgi:hypothetical protein